MLRRYEDHPLLNFALGEPVQFIADVAVKPLSRIARVGIPYKLVELRTGFAPPEYFNCRLLFTRWAVTHLGQCVRVRHRLVN